MTGRSRGGHPSGSKRFGDPNGENVPSLRPTSMSARGQAPLAQSAERFHGKEKVNGSIPLGGSVVTRRAKRRRVAQWLGGTRMAV